MAEGMGDPNAPPASATTVPGPLYVTAGGIQMGTAILPTTSVSGFLNLPSCAGTPTGTPSPITPGTIPCIIDSTNNFLYLYIGGGWKKSTVYS